MTLPACRFAFFPSLVAQLASHFFCMNSKVYPTSPPPGAGDADKAPPTPSPGDESFAPATWLGVLAVLERELPPQQFRSWIRPLRAELRGDRLILTAPNGFVLQWVRQHHIARIEAVLQQVHGPSLSLTLAVQNGTETMTETGTQSPMTGVPSSTAGGTPTTAPSPSAPLAGALDAVLTQIPAAAPVPAAAAVDTEYEKTRLNPAFTFDTLVSGRSNDLARAAAQQVAINPGASYNPLFIYGGVGLGKTHLAHALGNEVWRQHSSRVVRYLHAHDYIADVVRAYQQKAFDSFKRYYCSLDLLIIDDIQFFNGKDRTQEEFFFAFNALIEAKKQIVITCDTYPKDIQGLEHRLISRFDCGLIVQIEPPELEMRVAILKKKAQNSGRNLNDDVAFLIAKNLRSNVRELEGALNRVTAYADFLGRDITVELAREALKDIIGAFNRQITLELIQKTVADYYKIKVAEMYSHRRTRAVARPRQVAMWLARELTAHSLPEIGEAFGGRDHTTVLHACRTIADLSGKDSALKNDLHVLLQTIRG